MKFLKQLNKARTKNKYTVDQHKALQAFCSNKISIEVPVALKHLSNLRKLDKKRYETAPPINFCQQSISLSGSIIISPYSNDLFALIERLYQYKAFHIYIIKDQDDSVPFLTQLTALKRVSLINHRTALTLDKRRQCSASVFISVPEFHPKSVSSEHLISIFTHRCKFSSYSWLLKKKQQLPIYYLDKNSILVKADCAINTYKALEAQYNSSPESIFSWSRLNGHKESELSQRFISQANQLEALLRYMRPHFKSIDLQLTLETITKNKLAILAGSLNE